MAEGKKSFVAYCDWGDIFDELSNEEAGLLVKHLFDYVRDKNPTPQDQLTKMMFVQMQHSLKRDLVKYDKYIDKQKVNGAKGGRPKNNPEKPKEPKPLSGNPTEPKKADSVNVTVNVINKEEEFKNSLRPYVKTYGADMLNKFYDYWSETNTNGKKMRFEYAKNQPFNISRRLGTWSSNQQSFTPKQTQGRL